MSQTTVTLVYIIKFGNSWMILFFLDVVEVVAFAPPVSGRQYFPEFYNPKND